MYDPSVAPDVSFHRPSGDSRQSWNAPPDASTSSSTEEIRVPRMYQIELFKEACERNIIAVMDTGSGKTMIATMLLEHVCLKSRLKGEKDKQSDTIAKTTSLSCKSFCGETSGVDLWNREKWLEQLDIPNTDVVVCTPQTLINCLGHGYYSIDQLSLIVIDEVHHCRKNHPYSVLLQNFYHTMPAGGKRPKILGLTASPIWNVKQPQKSLDDLQAKTTCTILAVKDNTEELRAHAPKPNESVVFFKPDHALAPSKFASELMLLWGDFPIGKIDFEKVDTKATKAMNVLGPLGMDHYLLSQYAEPVAEALRTASFTPDADRARLGTLKYLNALMDDRRETWPTTVANEGDVTTKVRALASVLSQHRARAAADKSSAARGALIDLSDPDEAFQCIVFVQERHIAHSLAWVLERMPELKGWLKVRTLVGHAGAQKKLGETGQLSKNQRDTVKDFKNREFNVLISTSVGEEGLDFPACHLIVRFDIMPTIIAYLQSRGRARHQKSQFVLLVNEAAPVDMLAIEKFSVIEPVLKEVYKNSKASTQMAADTSNLSSHDAACREQYIIPSSGARLTYESTVQLVAQTCNLIPQTEGVSRPRPVYTVYSCIEDGGVSRFACDLLLPAATHIPLDRLRIRGTARSTKAEAKRAIAWEACKLLHEYGLLDDYLLPYREQRIETQEEAEKADALPEIEQDIQIEVDATWGNVWTSGTVYVHPISVDGVVSLALVSGKCLIQSKPFTLWAGRDGAQAMTVTILPSTRIGQGLPPAEFAAKLNRLDTWTRSIIHRILRPQWRDPKPIMCLFAPIRRSREIDWEMIDQTFDLCSWDDFDKERDVAFDPWWRPLRVEGIRPDLTPNSFPVMVEQDDGAPPECREKGAPSYLSFAKSRLLRDVKELPDPDRTMIQACLMERRRNNLVSRDVETRLERLAVGLERQRATSRLIMIRQICKFSRMSMAFYQSALLLPSVMRVVNDQNRIGGLAGRFGLQDVPYDTMHTALTPPSAMYGHDYQALETLGDSVLKLCTTVHTFNVYPHKHEGFLSILRANAVSNKFLRGHANDAGLGSMMITESVQVAKWDPPTGDQYTLDGMREYKMINRKWLQDCTEATLGACYLTGGFSLALEFGAKLDLMFGGTASWSSRYGGPRPKVDLPVSRDLKELQRTLGYSFNDPRFLLEAVTHPSTLGTESAPYQRLEYLGDALLDFIVLRRVYRDYPNAPPGDLTHLKQSMVANAPLCYLSIKLLGLHKYLVHNAQAVTKQIADGVALFDNVSMADLLALAWSFNPPKVTSDLVESCIGAIFIDCGWDVEKVDSVIMPWIEPLFRNVEYAPRIDPVGELWRWAFKEHRCAKIVFTAVKQSAKRPDAFPMDVHIHGIFIASGGDEVKKTAKNRAAYNAMKRLLADPRLMPSICKCLSQSAVPAATLVDI